jgi:energy-coupling factor transporter ATP-binding protein EcfA2
MDAPQALPRTVDLAYGAVDPDVPLEPGDPRYVDLNSARGDEDLPALIARRIRFTPAGSWHRQLLTGHRGSGKSTELKCLQGLLDQARFFTVYVDVEETLDLADVEYLDVLVAIARALDETARARKLRISPKLIEAIGDWFAETVLTEEQRRDVDRTLKTEYGVGLNVEMPLFARMMAAVTGQIRSGGSARKETRRKLEQRLPVLMERLNELVDDVTVRALKKGYKRLAVIADSLEKMNLTVLKGGQTNHSVLFVEHAEQLKALNCHVVYTVPISLLYDRNLGAAFGDVDVIPMVKITEDDGQTPCARGRDLLFEIVARRTDVDAVFDCPETLGELVVASGGVVRDLMRLVRFACAYTDDRIDAPTARRAFLKMVREYERLIHREDLELLAQVHRERRLPGSAPLSRLMYNRLVLPYVNGDRWMDVHPAVAAAPLFREHFQLERGQPVGQAGASSGT